jgi:hypothetical protein
MQNKGWTIVVVLTLALRHRGEWGNIQRDQCSVPAPAKRARRTRFFPWLVTAARERFVRLSKSHRRTASERRFSEVALHHE